MSRDEVSFAIIIRMLCRLNTCRQPRRAVDAQAFVPGFFAGDQADIRFCDAKQFCQLCYELRIGLAVDRRCLKPKADFIADHISKSANAGSGLNPQCQ